MNTANEPDLYKGRVALVTGGSKGLGRSISNALMARGCSVAVHYFSSTSEAGELAVTSAPHIDSARVETFHADLRQTKECELLIHNVHKTMDGLDFLINNAAILQRTPRGVISEDIWSQTMDLNLRSVAFLSMFAAQTMKEHGGGKIVNIGDLAGLEPWPAYLAHAVSKAGVHHLTRCLALAYAPHVQVNAVAPGLVDPPEGWSSSRRDRYLKRIPGGKPATPSDVADIICNLLSNDAITGQVIAVDRGQSLSF